MDGLIAAHATTLVLAAATGSDGYDTRPVLDARNWATLMTNLDRLDVARDGDEGGEGRWFYSGRGGEQSRLVPPPEATGMRILRWPHDGLDPEYVDLLFDDGRLPAPISTADLNFDVPQQPHSRLPAEQ